MFCGKEHRIDILRLALQNHIHVPEAINWDYYGNKTEGWVAQDLIDFAEKASFASWKRHGMIIFRAITLEDALL